MRMCFIREHTTVKTLLQTFAMYQQWPRRNFTLYLDFAQQQFVQYGGQNTFMQLHSRNINDLYKTANH